MNYSDKIKKLRKSKGINQIEMAEKIGISQAAYGKIESGFTKSITIEAGKGIAKALGVSFTELFEIEISGTGTNKTSGELEQLRERVKELEKRIDELEFVNGILKQEKLKYQAKLLWIELVDCIEIIGGMEIEIEKTTNENEKQNIEGMIKRNIDHVKKIIPVVIAGEVADRDFLMEQILYHSDKLRQMVKDDSKSKTDFVKYFINYINRFMNVTVYEVDEFLSNTKLLKW